MPERILGPIIGDLRHDHVKLWARSDGAGRLHAWLDTDPNFANPRRAGFSDPLTAESGYAGVVSVDGLRPETTYFYALTFENRPPAAPDGQFTTLPQPGTPRTLRFAFGSCFLPSSPESGETFRQIETLHQESGLSFLLMLGDQIYADIPKGNGLGRVALTLEDYRAVYRHTFSNSALQGLLKKLPVFMTLDDHEVDDDWRWQHPDMRDPVIPIWDRFLRWKAGEPPLARRLDTRRVRDALQAFVEHQMMHAPQPIFQPASDPLLRPGGFAYTFTAGGAAFFVLDTRTRRVRGRGQRPQIIDEPQWQALEAWLVQVRDHFPVKFIVSSSAVLFQFGLDIANDRWPGFIEDRRRLLSLIARHGVENVYILTGDLHAGHAISADLYGPNGKRLTIYELCATPFEQTSNWVTRFVTLRANEPPLTNRKLHFQANSWNFGVVTLNFENPETPQVQFDLHYRSPQGWQTHSLTTPMP